ncbi:MAG: hypothetical protein LUD22_02840, partial [Coprobacillus sp.]|nr:hypothetical protein [Coprobacillus sp.]
MKRGKNILLTSLLAFSLVLGLGGCNVEEETLLPTDSESEDLDSSHSDLEEDEEDTSESESSGFPGDGDFPGDFPGGDDEGPGGSGFPGGDDSG